MVGRRWEKESVVTDRTGVTGVTLPGGREAGFAQLRVVEVLSTAGPDPAAALDTLAALL
jgi:hypothetical protein